MNDRKARANGRSASRTGLCGDGREVDMQCFICKSDASPAQIALGNSYAKNTGRCPIEQGSFHSTRYRRASGVKEGCIADHRLVSTRVRSRSAIPEYCQANCATPAKTGHESDKTEAGGRNRKLLQEACNASAMISSGRSRSGGMLSGKADETVVEVFAEFSFANQFCANQH